MAEDERYTIDLDWVWGDANRELDGVATLRATIANPVPGVAEHEVDTWLETLKRCGDGAYVQGGWAAEVRQRSALEVVLDLVSGGQDVADALADAIDGLQDAIGGGTSISWQPQPIQPSPH